MEQIYLTNTCEYNEKNLAAAMKLQLQETQKKKNLFLALLIGALLAYSLFEWLGKGNQTFLIYAILSLVMGGLLLYTNFGLPRVGARKQIPLIREKNGGLRFQAQFREEGVAMLNPMGEESAFTPYRDFVKLAETPELLMLLTESKKMILLDRKGFRNGTEADFRTLIKERMPQLVE